MEATYKSFWKVKTTVYSYEPKINRNSNKISNPWRKDVFGMQDFDFVLLLLSNLITFSQISPQFCLNLIKFTQI